MKIERFFDESLAHNSYALLSDQCVALIDPARNPKQYYNFASQNNAQISVIIETHPHADFISSHLEISKNTKATIYCSKLTKAEYPHKTFDEGDTINLGKLKLISFNTPGHSPDSICIMVIDENQKEHALLTGDTLFIGDLGRPDLRETAGNITAKKEDLAKAMYKTTRERLMKLNKELLIYPAHGSGTLCGSSVSNEPFSTLEQQLKTNYALQPMEENEFVKLLLKNQPFIPKYFEHAVNINKKGADNFEESINKVTKLASSEKLDENILIIDARNEKEFKKKHFKNAINIPLNGLKFETWVGTILNPLEKFYLIAESEKSSTIAIERISKIGYEANIKGAMVITENAAESSTMINLDEFESNLTNYTIIDVRNISEVLTKKIFKDSINIPLPVLRERVNEISTSKPIVVHCASGYRSAIGASIIFNQVKDVPVFDLGSAVKSFDNI